MKKLLSVLLMLVMIVGNICFVNADVKDNKLEETNAGNVTVEEVKAAVSVNSLSSYADKEKYLNAETEEGEKIGDVVNPDLTLVIRENSTVIVVGESVADPEYVYYIGDTGDSMQIVKGENVKPGGTADYWFDYDAIADIINRFDLGKPIEIAYENYGLKIVTENGEYFYATKSFYDLYGKKTGADYYSFEKDCCYDYSDYEMYLKDTEANEKIYRNDTKVVAKDDKDDEIVIEKNEETKKEIEDDKEEVSENAEVERQEEPIKQEKVYTTTIHMNIGSKNMTVNNTVQEMDVAPVIVNERTMLPIRFVAEALGAVVSWDGASQAVEVKLDGKSVVVQIDSDIAYVNGEAVRIDTKPFLENSRTYLPVNFIATSLGADVFWDNAEKKVSVYK